MAFSRQALERVPHQASSLVEDLEYGVALAKAGIRVVYAHDTRVWAEMPNDDDAAESQRRRWERGRELMRREHGWKLLRSAFSHRDRVRADLAADVMLPPLTTVAKQTILASAVAGSLAVFRRRFVWALVPSGVAVLGLGFHVVTGFRRSSAGMGVLRGIPAYVRWKAGLTSRSPDADNSWVRTKRNAELALAERAESGESKCQAS